MTFKYLYKNFFLVLIFDLLFLVGSIYTALLIRFEFTLPSYYSVRLLRILPVVLVTKIVCFYFFDLYRGMWRFTSISDLLNVIKAASVSSLLIISYILLHYRFIGYSRSVFFMDWCFTVLFISGFRLGIRLYFEYVGKDQNG